MKITFHPAAEQDLLEAAAFYEREGSPALAARFVAEFKRMGSLLLELPEIGSSRSLGRRCIAMSIFPYTLFYKVTGMNSRSWSSSTTVDAMATAALVSRWRGTRRLRRSFLPRSGFVQLCIQADRGSGSPRKPASAPRRLNAALGLI